MQRLLTAIMVLFCGAALAGGMNVPASGGTGNVTLDQTTPQTFTGGAPVFGAGLVAQAATDASLGAEIIDTAADRTFASDSGHWTGTNWTVGSNVYTHVAGANAATLAGYAATNAATYQVVMTVVTTTPGTLTITYGGVSASPIGQAAGTLTAYAVLLTATGTGGLVLTPDAAWAGTVDDVSVKRLTHSEPALIGKNLGGDTVWEFRASDVDSLALGGGALQDEIGSGGNTAVGRAALHSTTAGQNNTAVGYNVMHDNTTGANNTAIGGGAARLNVSGDSNVSIGQDTAYSNRSSSYNVAVGSGTLYSNLAAGNTGVGYSSLGSKGPGENNTALGWAAGNFRGAGNDALDVATDSIFIGANTRAAANSESNQIVIGTSAVGAGSNTTTIGNSSQTKVVLGGVGAQFTSTGLDLPAGQGYTVNGAGIGGGSPASTTTMSGDITLTASSDTYQLLDPNGGNRSVNLPASPASDVRFVISNVAAGTSTYYLEVKLSGDTGTNYFTRLYSGSEPAEFVYDTATSKWACPTSATVRTNATTYSDGKLGYSAGGSADGSISGVGVGYSATGRSYGTAVGQAANGASGGAAVGNSATGNSYGAAVGYSANGGSYSAALGAYAQTNIERNAVALGFSSWADRAGEVAHAIKESSNGGYSSSKLSIPGWYGVTTTPTASQELLCGGVSAKRYVLRSGSSIAFDLVAVARDNVNGTSKAWKITGLISNTSDGATCALVGSVTYTVIAATPTATDTWDIVASADNTNKALKLAVTPDTGAAKTIRWTVTGVCSEVCFQ